MKYYLIRKAYEATQARCHTSHQPPGAAITVRMRSATSPGQVSLNHGQLFRLCQASTVQRSLHMSKLFFCRLLTKDLRNFCVARYFVQSSHCGDLLFRNSQGVKRWWEGLIQAQNAPTPPLSTRDFDVKRLGSINKDGGDLSRCRQSFAKKISLIILGFSVQSKYYYG